MKGLWKVSVMSAAQAYFDSIFGRRFRNLFWQTSYSNQRTMDGPDWLFQFRESFHFFWKIVEGFWKVLFTRRHSPASARLRLDRICPLIDGRLFLGE